MTILVDANIFFDVVGRRQPHYAASNHILVLCGRRALSGTVAMHTVANLFYEYGKAVVPFLQERLLQDFAVQGASSAMIADTLRAGFKDWEDALQCAAAHTAAAAFIVTRNVKDFKYSPVPALTPTDFLRRFHPD